MTDSIDRNAMPGDDQQPDPANGFVLVAIADRKTKKCEAAVSISAGDGHGYGPEIDFANRALMDFGPDPDPRLIRYSIVREAMLILCETWEVTVGEAWPSDIKSHWTDNLSRIAWMKYVSPRFAPLITPPASVIAERRPNGGLFLAATKETFETANRPIWRQRERSKPPCSRLFEFRVRSMILIADKHHRRGGRPFNILIS